MIYSSIRMFEHKNYLNQSYGSKDIRVSSFRGWEGMNRSVTGLGRQGSWARCAAGLFTKGNQNVEKKDVRAAWAGEGGIFKGKEMGRKVVWAKNKERRNGLRNFLF
jgi:hypothetical protein